MVCQRCRGLGFMGHVVSVGCMGADYDRPTGFSRQMKMEDPSNITMQVYHWACKLLAEHWDGLPIRRVGISLTQLTPDNEYQLSLFDTGRERQMALERTTDALKLKYGNSIVIRAVSKTAAGQALDRSAKIGGHYK
ncbi:hypothetical protein M2277_005704 [Paenibacillus sp. LBL]|nr:hypothetical protein [Paenibacillus sp. LBL]